MKRPINLAVLSLLFALPVAVVSQTQTDPQGYSISTPRPINLAASTTNPSALATQSQNPYLGSTPSGKATDEVIALSLRKVAEKNEALAERALTQSRDRYGSGVTNYLEVIQAQEAVTAARENHIQSLYSFNVAKAALARAMGAAERRFAEFFGAK